MKIKHLIWNLFSTVFGKRSVLWRILFVFHRKQNQLLYVWFFLSTSLLSFFSSVVSCFRLIAFGSPWLAMNHYCFRSITGWKVFNLESSSTLKKICCDEVWNNLNLRELELMTKFWKSLWENLKEYVGVFDWLRERPCITPELHCLLARVLNLSHLWYHSFGVIFVVVIFIIILVIIIIIVIITIIVLCSLWSTLSSQSLSKSPPAL